MTKAYAMLVVVYFMSSVVLITLGLSITKPAGLDNKFSTYSNKRFGDYKVRWQSTENSGTPVVFL